MDRDLMYSIADTIMFSLLFLFYAFILVPVIKKRDIIIIMMIISLSLAAASRLAEYIHYMSVDSERREYLFENTKISVYFFIAFMFFNVAGLMNISKWVYFIVVSKGHMKIRS